MVEVSIGKTGPITVVAGSLITYNLTVFNSGPFTAEQAIVVDTMPFQVQTITATFAVPAGLVGTCIISPAVAGDIVQCALGDIPPGATAAMTVTAKVDPNTPLGADLTNRARLTAKFFRL